MKNGVEGSVYMDPGESRNASSAIFPMTDAQEHVVIRSRRTEPFLHVPSLVPFGICGEPTPAERRIVLANLPSLKRIRQREYADYETTVSGQGNFGRNAS